MCPPRATRRSVSRTPMPQRDHRMSQIMTIKCGFGTQKAHPNIKFLTGCPHRSAFFLFCAEFRPKVKSENPGLTIGDTAKKLGEMWNSKTAEDKQPYEKKAAKLKEKYDKVTAHCPYTVKNDLFLFLHPKNVPFVILRTSLRTARRAKWILNQLPQQTTTRRKMRKKRRMTTTMKMMMSKL